MISESQNIEYKESWRDEYLKWICGFANAQGGRIYIGVSDNKEVIGLSDAKKLMEDIPNKIVNFHSLYPRNNNIANVFFKAGFVESWGRGFKKIAEEFERAHLPLPTIEENGGGVTATILRKTVNEVISERVGVNGGDGGNVAVIQLTNRQKLILSLVAKSLTITAKQMAVMTDIPQRTIERELSTLQKLSIICREGSPRTGSWVIINKRCLD